MLSRDEVSGKTEPKKVTSLSSHLAPATMALTLSDGSHVECTPEHPFYVQGKGWTAARECGVGTSIVTRAGPAVQVKSVEHFDRPAKVFNFSVQDAHSYFVGTGAAWVHNVCMEDRWIQLAEEPNSRLPKEVIDHIRRHNGRNVSERFGLELAHLPKRSNAQGFDYAEALPKLAADHRGIEHRYLRESANGTTIRTPRSGTTPRRRGPLSRPWPGSLPQ